MLNLLLGVLHLPNYSDDFRYHRILTKTFENEEIIIYNIPLPRIKVNIVRYSAFRTLFDQLMHLFHELIIAQSGL